MKKNPSITLKLKRKKRKEKKNGTLKKVDQKKVKCGYCNLKYVEYGHYASNPNKVYGYTCARCWEVHHTIKSFRNWKGKKLTPKLLKKTIKELLK